MNRLVENDLVVFAGLPASSSSGDEVLVAEHSVGPGQAEEAEHAAHSALRVEHEMLIVNRQTMRSEAELLALLEHHLCVVRPLLQTRPDVVLIAAADHKTA